MSGDYYMRVKQVSRWLLFPVTQYIPKINRLTKLSDKIYFSVDSNDKVTDKNVISVQLKSFDLDYKS